MNAPVKYRYADVRIATFHAFMLEPKAAGYDDALVLNARGKRAEVPKVSRRAGYAARDR